jgi:hypothetical protein
MRRAADLDCEGVEREPGGHGSAACQGPHGALNLPGGGVERLVTQPLPDSCRCPLRRLRRQPVRQPRLGERAAARVTPHAEIPPAVVEPAHHTPALAVGAALPQLIAERGLDLIRRPRLQAPAVAHVLISAQCGVGGSFAVTARSPRTRPRNPHGPGPRPSGGPPRTPSSPAQCAQCYARRHGRRRRKGAAPGAWPPPRPSSRGSPQRTQHEPAMQPPPADPGHAAAAVP